MPPKFILVFVILLVILGCKLINPKTAANNSILPTATVTNKDSGLPVKLTNEVPITLGKYTVENENPINRGNAEVSSKGNGLYHLYVSVFRGVTAHEGEIDSDFKVISGEVSMLNDEYSDVKVDFSGNILTIDFPDSEHHGGGNADPKGLFYLRRTESLDNPFMEKLFDSIKLDQKYRVNSTNVYVTAIVVKKQLILVQSQSNINGQNILSEKVVIYNEDGNEFQYIGEITNNNMIQLTNKLVGFGFDHETIYRTLMKEYSDRTFHLLLTNFINRGIKGFDKSLTEKDAFYIATGQVDTTSLSDNNRNKENVGSIYIAKVDHSDDKTVTIHKYENVRDGDGTTQIVNNNWIIVDRSSLEVTKRPVSSNQ